LGLKKVEETRNIAISYGVDILTDNYFVLSQSMHLIDGQTNRQTESPQQKSALIVIFRCALKIEKIF